MSRTRTPGRNRVLRFTPGSCSRSWSRPEHALHTTRTHKESTGICCFSCAAASDHSGSGIHGSCMTYACLYCAAITFRQGVCDSCSRFQALKCTCRTLGLASSSAMGELTASMPGAGMASTSVWKQLQAPAAVTVSGHTQQHCQQACAAMTLNVTGKDTSADMRPHANLLLAALRVQR